MPKQKQPHNKTVAEVLEYAALCVKHGWAQGTLARDVDGYTVEPRDPVAVCWCVDGAIARATSDRALAIAAEEALGCFVKPGYGPGARIHTVSWNDAPGRTQSQVVAALRAAAKAAR